MGVSLVTLNIERDRHLSTAVRFIRERQPDITCLQELFEADMAFFEEVLGVQGFFVPMARSHHSTERGPLLEGIGIFSKLPVISRDAVHYAGNPGEVVDYIEGTPQEKLDTQSYSLATITVEKEGKSYKIGTTHFPWTPDGQADDIQRESLTSLLSVLGSEGELVFCGDFNAPRGGEIFAGLAEQYTDNVPAGYTTSLDTNVHRAGKDTLEAHAASAGLTGLMVDGLFSTPGYAVSNVEMVCGVSDHCALTALIEKK